MYTGVIRRAGVPEVVDLYTIVTKQYYCTIMDTMSKILILVLVIACVSFLLYQQGLKNTPSQSSTEVYVKSDSTVTSTSSASEIREAHLDTGQVISKGITLNLSSKGLIETPKYVFDRTDIETLDLSNNKLTGSLQAEIRFLQNLKVLDLSNNQFTGVPAEIGQLKNLEVLDLSNNRITGLPLELGNLSNLKVLNLKGNEYSKYDLGLIKEKLPALTVIEID